MSWDDLYEEQTEKFLKSLSKELEKSRWKVKLNIDKEDLQKAFEVVTTRGFSNDPIKDIATELFNNKGDNYNLSKTAIDKLKKHLNKK